MSQPSAHKKFIFNEKIDDLYLFSLYEQDYAYITEVFGSSLQSLKEETGVLMSAFESSNLPDLKRAAHKIKPVFGFTGLLHHQERVSRFEQLCENASGIDSVTMHYMELIEELKDGKKILKEDYSRLTDFIA